MKPGEGPDVEDSEFGPSNRAALIFFPISKEKHVFQRKAEAIHWIYPTPSN